MRITNMPACCTISIVSNFGESEYSPGRSVEVETKEHMIEQLRNYIRNSPAMAALVATTNSDQETAMAALREVGFVSTKAMTKSQHPTTTVRLWHYKINEPEK